MPDILLHLLLPGLACLLYAALSFHFWRTRWHLPVSTVTVRLWENLLLCLALALHGISLYDLLFGDGGMRFSFSLALSLMLWLAVLIHWLENFRVRLDALQPLILPFAAICTVFPLFFPQMRVIAHADALVFRLHFIAAMLAYGLFTLAVLYAVLMGIVERKLHQNTLNSSLARLPPLLAMEGLLFHLIFSAFVLLTLVLGSGILFSEEIFGKPLIFDHKTLFGVASWLVFAALLLGRRIYGWRGRVALRWTITGFVFLLLAYVGSRFVTEVLLGRV